MNLIFFTNSALLGIGLAMDAFSVSISNGLNEPRMSKRKMFGIAGLFAFFQGLMPMLGWVCVHTAVEKFEAFEKYIPWTAFLLLLFIGVKMLAGGLKNKNKDVSESPSVATGFAALTAQGIATSIDALSVGFTIASYSFFYALICAAIIAAVTFVLCSLGVAAGKKFGYKLSNKSEIFGGAILIIIGLEIFIRGLIN